MLLNIYYGLLTVAEWLSKTRHKFWSRGTQDIHTCNNNIDYVSAGQCPINGTRSKNKGKKETTAFQLGSVGKATKE